MLDAIAVMTSLTFVNGNVQLGEGNKKSTYLERKKIIIKNSK